jgi:hypothetical protein
VAVCVYGAGAWSPERPYMGLERSGPYSGSKFGARSPCVLRLRAACVTYVLHAACVTCAPGLAVVWGRSLEPGAPTWGSIRASSKFGAWSPCVLRLRAACVT